MSREERLFTLVQCLLASERYLTAARIRQTVPGYGPDEPDEAVKRKFERDKSELRRLGIPIETVRDPMTGEDGYRIDRSAYELAPIELTPDESLVVVVAAQVWRKGKLAGPAAGALLKLRASGAPMVTDPVPGIDALVDTSEPAFDAVWRACRDGRPITFDYHKPAGGSARRRILEPWGMVCRNGLWYVAGHDRDRDATRVFRLSRVVGDVRSAGDAGTVRVPDDVDLRAIVLDWGEPRARQSARLLIRRGAANGLRRYAAEAEPADRPGWDRVALDLYGLETLAGHVASFGADVLVCDPPELRDAVIRRLKGVLG